MSIALLVMSTGLAAAAPIEPVGSAQCTAILAKASKGIVLSKEEQGTVAVCFFSSGRGGIAPAIEYSTVSPGFFNKDTLYGYVPPHDAVDDWKKNGG